MTDTPQPATPPADRDQLTRFLIQGAGVRGVRVHLHDSWQQIRERTADSSGHPRAMQLLGQATAAAALFTGHAKVDGRLSVQLRSEGPLRTVFAECTAANTVRGIVQVDDARGPVPHDLRELGDGAMLAITIENRGGTREPVRYQGVVALQAGTLAGVFEDYFRQSEQLPTRLLLAADAGNAAGLMLQKLPGDAGDNDGWNRAGALFDTLDPAELLEWPAATLFSRVFHEDGVQALGEKPLRFACSCSRERVESMLVSLGEAEALAAAAGGTALVRCEFCGQRYSFERDEIRGLLRAAATEADAPQRLQ